MAGTITKIAVDAMGGDFAPREIVYGAVLAARDLGIAVQLVGPPEIIEKELQRHKIDGLAISIVAATEVVSMDEKPSRAIVKKKDSSIIVTTRQVSSGAADGMVAAGSTGAAAVAAQLELGRIANVSRCAIACSMPTSTDNPALLIDVGANSECDAQQLLQFAQMGSLVYAALYHSARPRVGILNLGSEETKGTDLVRESYQLMQNRSDLNFIGFVEGRDFPMGKVDVVVTDGFVGNVALKTAEGIAKMIKLMLKQELMASWPGKIGAAIAKSAFDRVEKIVFRLSQRGSTGNRVSMWLLPNFKDFALFVSL